MIPEMHLRHEGPCEKQPDELTDALWDWMDDEVGHEFIEFLHARGLDVVQVKPE